MGESRTCRVVLVSLAAAVAAVAVPQLAVAGAREEQIPAQLVTKTQPSGTGCHASTFAVVADAPDVAQFSVTWTSTAAPGREYTQVFNRHERGNLPSSQFPTWSPGAGKVAGLLVANSLDGPGDAAGDCTTIEAEHKQRYAVARATVTRYVPDRPTGKAAAYEVRSVAATQANEGSTGKDSCVLAHFVSFPPVAGAKRYRITVTDSITGVRRTRTTVVDAAGVNPSPPASSGIRPYRRAGRLGHLLYTQTKPGWGCRYQEWQVAAQVEKVVVTAERA